MRTAIGLSLLALATCVPARADDPVNSDGDKYKVVFENECVRVLDYRDQPGERTHQHRHPAFVLVAMAPFRRQLSLPDGRVIQREFKQGDVLYSPEQTHIGENVGSTPTHAIITEMKPGAACPAPKLP